MHRAPGPTSSATVWSKRLHRTLLLLAIWFLVGPVMGILLVDPLNEVTLGGIPLGFWVSQQGSIYVFILLIFAYAWIGDRLDTSARGRPESTPDPGPAASPTTGPGMSSRPGAGPGPDTSAQSDAGPGPDAPAAGKER